MSSLLSIPRVFFFTVLTCLFLQTSGQQVQYADGPGEACTLRSRPSSTIYCSCDGICTEADYTFPPSNFLSTSCGQIPGPCQDPLASPQCQGNDVYMGSRLVAIPSQLGQCSSKSDNCVYTGNRWDHICCPCPDGYIPITQNCSNFNKLAVNYGNCVACSDGATVPQLNLNTNQFVCPSPTFLSKACELAKANQKYVDMVNDVATLFGGICQINKVKDIAITVLSLVVATVNNVQSQGAAGDKKALIDNIVAAATGLAITGFVVGAGIVLLPEEGVLAGLAAAYVLMCDWVGVIGLLSTGISEAVRFLPSCNDFANNNGNPRRSIDSPGMIEHHDGIMLRDGSGNPCLDYLALFPTDRTSIPALADLSTRIQQYTSADSLHPEEINVMLQIQSSLRDQSSNLQTALNFNNWLEAIEAFAPYCGENSDGSVATTTSTSSSSSTSTSTALASSISSTASSSSVFPTSTPSTSSLSVSGGSSSSSSETSASNTPSTTSKSTLSLTTKANTSELTSTRTSTKRSSRRITTSTTKTKSKATTKSSCKAISSTTASRKSTKTFTTTTKTHSRTKTAAAATTITSHTSKK